MRFNGIDLLLHFGFVLSNPDFLTAKVWFARKIQSYLSRRESVNVFSFLKSDIQLGSRGRSEENPNCLRSDYRAPHERAEQSIQAHAVLAECRREPRYRLQSIIHNSSRTRQPYGLGAGVGRALGVGSDRGVGVGLGVAVGVPLGVTVAVGVAVAVGVGVGVAVGVGETVGVGVGVALPLGDTRTK
jgi:hypothetical protein